MSTTGYILIATVFDLGRIVSMTGSGAIFEVVVVTGTGVCVFDNCGNGSTAGISIHDSCQKLRTIGFLSCGGVIILTGRSAVKKILKLFKIHGKTGRNSVKGHADSRTMGLSENGQL
jgi:hypothetical protein